MKRTFGLVCCWCMISAICLTQTLFAQNDFAAELPRVPPTSPEEALATFQLADGFQIQQIAAEPLLASPVAIQWDERGRLYVCEMRGYSEQRDEALSRIAVLTDSDGDGVYDRRTEFAKGLLWPTAIFPWDGGLFVGDAPDILYLKDTDGDGAADVRKTVLTGFGTSNVQGLLNSFRWGLDNQIHVACSSVGGKVRRPEQDQGQAVDIRGRDLAFDPKTMAFRLTSGAAQHGMCFDDWGRKFVCSNSDHIQQVMYEERYMVRNPLLRAPRYRVSIAIDGPQAEVFRTSPVEPWRIVRTRLRVGGLVPGPIEGGGRAAGYFTGATGLTIFRGDRWPENLKGTALIGDVGSNLIHRKELKLHSLQFAARRMDAGTEFLTSTDIWFRPAQFEVGPDGALTVIDVCREVIEHPKSLPPQIKQHLDLTAGRNRGRLYRITPTQFQHRATPTFAEMSNRQLIAFLAHENAWHRETAARLLSLRSLNQEDRSQLDSMAIQSDSALGRLHALYVLDGIGALTWETVLQALGDPHPGIRRHAVRLSERVDANPELIDKLCSLATDESVEVRYQLAFTIGEIECDCRDSVLANLVSSHADDLYFRAAIQSSVGDDASGLFVHLMSPGMINTRNSRLMLAALTEQVVIQDDGHAVDALNQATKQRRSDAAFFLPILSQFLKRSVSGKHSPERVSQLREQVVETASSVVSIAMDSERGIGQRREAILALGSLRGTKVDHGWCETLCGLIEPAVPVEIQQAVIGSIGKVDSRILSERLLQSWESLSPRLRNAAMELFFSESSRIKDVFDRIDSGRLSVSDVPRQRLELASASRDARVALRAKKLLAESTSTDRAEVVRKYRESLNLSGEAERGRMVFKKHCASCHRLDGVGHEVGPNLKAMGARGAESILVNVLDPSREVNPQYINYAILTVEGRTLTGMIDSESANSIVLKRADSVSESVLRGNVERLESTGQSLMPSGLERVIDLQSMADLIAFLLRG